MLAGFNKALIDRAYELLSRYGVPTLTVATIVEVASSGAGEAFLGGSDSQAIGKTR
jgi:hypothetical protein